MDFIAQVASACFQGGALSAHAVVKKCSGGHGNRILIGLVFLFGDVGLRFSRSS